MKRTCIALTLALASTGVAAEGAFNSAEDAIEYRQAAFSLIKENFSDMWAMMKEKKPMDEKAFAQRAQHLSLLAQIPFTSFDIAGSDKGDTSALPAIWQQRDAFDAKAGQFQMATERLALVAKEGDAKAIKQAFGAVGKTCKGCHDDFKAE
ncbi:cytochrome c prime [Ferrimonas balearica DSM 9799]|uniref:Cytochrome c prime n=1 Tax=Ferrimonas balearica (strain DSM 9799 / CCM 4581 / KCTC 23876 / PAT) TaxID=550540 RepID=E1SSC7_FERBD|nr:cytochrome c [Ferrimonas balearica]ADN74967.1 cytochrome c prime [Ferrimonas balearica DSM 9799]